MKVANVNTVCSNFSPDGSVVKLYVFLTEKWIREKEKGGREREEKSGLIGEEKVNEKCVWILCEPHLLFAMLLITLPAWGDWILFANWTAECVVAEFTLSILLEARMLFLDNRKLFLNFC